MRDIPEHAKGDRKRMESQAVADPLIVRAPVIVRGGRQRYFLPGDEWSHSALYPFFERKKASPAKRTEKENFTTMTPGREEKPVAVIRAVF
jgi:hypothetical protein